MGVLKMTARDFAVLLSNRIPFSFMREFLEKQREAVHGYCDLQEANAIHAALEIRSRKRNRALFLKKTFGVKRRIPATVLTELASDYLVCARVLRSLGLGPLVQNYRLLVNLDSHRPTMSIEQLFFPFGTPLQWLYDENRVRLLVSLVARNYISPLMKNLNRNRSNSCPVFVDLAFKNFAVLPVGSGDLRLYYFDFFPPRVRNMSGEIKGLGYPSLHTHPPREIEYRFLNLAGIVHNFLIKSIGDLSCASPLQSAFIDEARVHLDPLLMDRFGVGVASLLDLDFAAGSDMFLSWRKGDKDEGEPGL